VTRKVNKIAAHADGIFPHHHLRSHQIYHFKKITEGEGIFEHNLNPVPLESVKINLPAKK